MNRHETFIHIEREEDVIIVEALMNGEFVYDLPDWKNILFNRFMSVSTYGSEEISTLHRHLIKYGLGHIHFSPLTVYHCYSVTIVGCNHFQINPQLERQHTHLLFFELLYQLRLHIDINSDVKTRRVLEDFINKFLMIIFSTNQMNLNFYNAVREDILIKASRAPHYVCFVK